MSAQPLDLCRTAPGAVVADLNLSPNSRTPIIDGERRRILIEWNDTNCDYPRDHRLHRLIEEQVARTPEAVALTCGDRSLTYRQLNARANRLGHHLRSLGVGPGALVGLFAERSPEMVVGLLGILKAGGAYVPLDPDYPVGRLGLMLEDAHPAVVLTHEYLEARLPASQARILCLDRNWGRLAAHNEGDPKGGARREDLAYVIYTSGSTGVPKGAMNTHEGICNRLLWMQEAYGLTAEDRVLQKTPYSFDVSVWEFFWPLLAGARLVLARPGGHREPAYLAGLIEEAGITIIHFVPSMLQVFLEQPGLDRSCRTLRHVFASGEALPEAVARRSLGRLPGRLHNLYGPTEAAVDVTYWECRSEDPPGPVPIGRPIANMRVYVLDAYLQPVSVGVAGELYLGGIGVARGYLNRPELTAERFLDDPYDARPGARLYRTGDMVRWRPDGAIEFLGRLDDQVKLRGFRIELGEIEAALARHPAVRQAVVVLREDRPGDPRLVAYLLASEDGLDPDEAELRAFVSRSLPEYMVPSAFVALAAFPLNANGKLDRKALPAPLAPRADGEAVYVAPRDATERALATIWKEVLGVERVGVHENFLHLGGHSLLAARATARASDRLGVEIPARALFDAPTIAGLAERIARLRHDDGPRPPLTRRSDEASPLSFAQQRLWFLDRLEGRLAAYNMSTAVRLGGELDVEALRLALGAIVARHEPLRTTFEAPEGRPAQRIHPPSPLELGVEDLRDLAPARHEAALAERLRQEADRLFDLGREPALRASLLRLAEAEHLLLVTMHHIASDGWSMTVFWRELTGLYDGYRRGEEAVLAELPVRYRDYATWQREVLVGPRLERLVSYWRDRLEGLTPLELPTDRLRPSTLSYRGATHEFTLPEGLVGRFRELARDAGATLHMAMLGAFQVLLMRHSGQEDIVVGMPAAGRGRSELDGLIGFFVNTLVLRVDLSGNPGFRELLARVKTASLEAYDHQDLPFEQLVEHLRPERHHGRSPIVQVLFQMMDFPTASPQLAGLEVAPQPIPGRHVRFDLEFALRPLGEGLHVEIAYSTDLFDGLTIGRLAGHFHTLLEAIADQPDRRVHELPLLTEAERRRILVDWNDTAVEYPRDRCVHQLFEEQVARSPDAMALICGGRSLTYGRLNARANQLARRLRAMGVTAEARVGLRLGRSPELIVAILGILKAGGAYVPLAPDDPEGRIRRIVEDAGITAMITEAKRARGGPGLDVPTLRLDEQSPDLDRLADTDLTPAASPSSLAYVMYTSGSTGEPKGVSIENRSVVRLVRGVDYATFGPDRVFLQLAPSAFDASTFEIWGALLHGARLVLAPDGPPDLDELGRLIKARGVTTIWLTAGLFNEIVESRPATLAGVREILTGGEALSPKHVRIAYQRLPQPLRIINGYGPTESTTFACCHPIDPAGLDLADNIPIGRPIGNTRAYVLDAHGQPVPAGVAGELHLGGDGLARGYLGRPGVTAERFVAGLGPDERLYRTGDRARWRPDGTLEFLGRLDDQVKLRGFRVELGEIEQALARHPAVRQALVLLREDRPGDRRLVAYLAVGDDRSPGEDELRAFLSRGLPDHMVPSAFVPLAAFPLNANGKLDRKALPAPGARRTDGEPGYVPPRDAAERQLASIWEEVLGAGRVGVRDDFFQLGGHSLLAIRLLARIEDVLGVKLPIAAVFRAGTVEGMARMVGHREESSRNRARVGGEEADDRVVPLQPSGDQPPVFMLPGMRSHVIALRDLALLIGGERPIYGLQPSDLDLGLLPHPTLEELASELIKDIRRVAGSGPYHLFGFSAGGLIAYEIARQLRDSGEPVGMLGLLDTYGPGYARPLPLHTRLARHLRMIRRLESRDRFRYAIDRGQAILSRFRPTLTPSRRRLHAHHDRPAPTDRVASYSWKDVKDRYRPGAYGGRIDLFAASKPDWLGTDFSDPMMGWGPLAGEVRVHEVPGSHLEIVRMPRVNDLALAIRNCLGLL